MLGEESKSEKSKRWMVGWAVEDWILKRVGWGSTRKGHVMGEVMNANVIGAVTCLASQGSYLYLLTKQQQNNSIFLLFWFLVFWVIEKKKYIFGTIRWCSWNLGRKFSGEWKVEKFKFVRWLKKAKSKSGFMNLPKSDLIFSNQHEYIINNCVNLNTVSDSMVKT